MAEKRADNSNPLPSGSSIMDNAVCFNLKLSSLHTRRKINNSAVKTDADKDMIHVAKDILDSPELRAVGVLDTEIRMYLYSRALPSLFRHGIYLLPLELVPEVDARMNEMSAKRDALVEKFCDTYPDKKEEAERRLAGLFDPTDYPPVRELRRSFSMQTSYMVFATPSSLKGISNGFFQREKAKAEKMWTEAAEEIRTALREAMAGLVEHLTERLSGSKDGKPKIFRDTLIAKMEDFLTTFKARNLSKDTELDALVEKARQLVKGVDAGQLRENDKLRTSVRKGFAEIKTNLDKMLVDKPKRKISFDDDK
jgi:hypothetical protein